MRACARTRLAPAASRTTHGQRLGRPDIFHIWDFRCCPLIAVWPKRVLQISPILVTTLPPVHLYEPWVVAGSLDLSQCAHDALIVVELGKERLSQVIAFTFLGHCFAFCPIPKRRDSEATGEVEVVGVWGRGCQRACARLFFVFW